MSKEIKIADLVDKVQSYYPAADVDLIRKAYDFSAKVHQGQKRLSGEPYLIHPMAVAGVIADLKMDVPSVIGGLLHDTVEDTLTTLEELKGIFGREIASLVDGVTKLSRTNFSSREEKQAENFRKMLLAMGKDVRVILIKLADRVHNMRTLDHLPLEKQILTAQETLDIYAPMAHRLGVAWIKTELEDLALKYLAPGDLLPAEAQRLQEGAVIAKSTSPKSFPSSKESLKRRESRPILLAGRSTFLVSTKRWKARTFSTTRFMTWSPFAF